MPEITLSYFKSSHQPWETSQRYKQFSWLQFIASNPFPEFLSPSGSYSRLPVTVAGPQRIDTVFSINAYCNLYPECNADVILTEKIRFHKVFMYSIWLYVSICFCTMNYLNYYIYWSLSDIPFLSNLTESPSVSDIRSSWFLLWRVLPHSIPNHSDFRR